MNIFQIFLILTFSTITHLAFSQHIEIPGPNRWEKRILLVFAAEETAAQKEQLEIFDRNPEGMKERELVVYEITGSKVVHPDGSQSGKEAADKLRKHYEVSEQQFSVILIGKDGSEKLRQNEVLSAEKLFAVIDSMPMRRQEMRRRDQD